MGQRISYYKNKFHGDIHDLLFKNYLAFREWYLTMHQTWMEEDNEPFGEEQIREDLMRIGGLQTEFEELPPEVTDRLAAAFTSEYTDYGADGGRLLAFFGPTMATWRYRASDPLILATQDTELITLYKYLTYGRSLKGGVLPEYEWDSQTGYLSVKEQVILKAKIEHYFGDLDQMTHQYCQSPDAIGGVEYVWCALEEIKEDQLELISNIEALIPPSAMR